MSVSDEYTCFGCKHLKCIANERYRGLCLIDPSAPRHTVLKNSNCVAVSKEVDMSSDESPYPILDDDEFWVFDDQGNVLEAWSEIALRTHYNQKKYINSFTVFRDNFITVNWADRMTRDELLTKATEGKYKLVIHEGCV